MRNRNGLKLVTGAALLATLLYALLAAVDGQRDLAQLADVLTDSCGKAVASEDVQHLLTEKLAPLGLLEHADGSAPRTQKAQPLLGLKLKVVVSDPAVTQRLTAPYSMISGSKVNSGSMSRSGVTRPPA